MKKIYSIVLMAAALLIGTNAWAADVTVVNETTGASNSYDGSTALQSAIDFIGAGQTGTITLNNPITLDSAVVMPHVTGAINATNPNVLNRAGQNITLNLNGKNIQGANNLGVIQILKGSLDITGTGEINRGSGSGGDNAKKSVITVYGAPWSNKSEVWTTLTVGENVTVKTEAAEKVYGICIQNSSALPTGVSTTETLGYTTYESVDIASAPTDTCWAPGSSNTKANSGCAYGVKLFVNGKVFGNYRGINVLGTINAAPQCDINENIKTRQNDAYPYYDYNYPYVNVGSTAQVWCINDGVANDNNGGIYGGGYAVYDISGTVYGQTGIYLKSGDLKLTDANIYSTATTVGTSAEYHKGVTAGAGIFIGTDAGYAGGTAVELEGDTKVSGGSRPDANGIIDVVATNAQSTGSSVSHVTVEGGTIEGGINLTSNTSDVTIVYGAQITGEIVVDGDTTTVATITPTGTHVTEVTINGKPTIVVSEGAGPQDDAKKTTWAEIAALSNKTAPADVAWTAVGEGTISSDLYFGELQMISGTNASNIQKLTINNGATLNVKNLMMNNFAQIVVEAGAKLIVNGEQGIVAPVASNIILKASNTAQGIFLFNPAVTSNRHPNATVEVYTNCYQLTQSPAKTYVRQRLAIPVMETGKPVNNFSGDVFPGSGASFSTYAWTWDGYKWAAITGWNQLKPFIGYTFSNNSQAAGVTYSFAGELVGNGDAEYNFPTGGFDYFGCSHVAPIYLDSLFKHFASDMEAAVWIYDFDAHQYNTITAEDLKEFPDVTEIKPMEAFVLNLHAASGKSGMDYASAVWGNPRFDAAIGRPSQKNPAPARIRFNDASNRAIVNITAENGYRDQVKLIEKDQYTAEFENGADANKLMFADGINLYATTEAGELARVATDDLKGTLLSFRAGNSAEYTITLTSVLGEDYALRDNVTGQVIAFAEGATYTFMQEANTTVPARFEVIAIAEVATAIENVEEAAKATGIYTITGQYVGRDFTNLPAGAYIVNGVKVIK